jgi:hypothetical protein
VRSPSDLRKKAGSRLKAFVLDAANHVVSNATQQEGEERNEKEQRRCQETVEKGVREDQPEVVARDASRSTSAAAEQREAKAKSSSRSNPPIMFGAPKHDRELGGRYMGAYCK